MERDVDGPAEAGPAGQLRQVRAARPALGDDDGPPQALRPDRRGGKRAQHAQFGPAQSPPFSLCSLG